MNIAGDIIAQLDRINNLYAESKYAIILLESQNPEQKTFLAPLNEMRNALDHIMKMVLNKDNPEEVYEQYRGAKSHIRRAGYDAYELLCISHVTYIFNVLKVFSPEDIAKGFPQYYSKIRPKIEELQGETAKLRLRRYNRKKEKNEIIDDNVVLDDDNTYKYYFEAYEELSNYKRIIDNHIPGLEECKRERLKKEKTRKYTFIIGIVLAIIGIVLTAISLFNI